jgi:hypothetical protein
VEGICNKVRENQNSKRGGAREIGEPSFKAVISLKIEVQDKLAQVVGVHL